MTRRQSSLQCRGLIFAKGQSDLKIPDTASLSHCPTVPFCDCLSRSAAPNPGCHPGREIRTVALWLISLQSHRQEWGVFLKPSSYCQQCQQCSSQSCMFKSVTILFLVKFISKLRITLHKLILNATLLIIIQYIM